jgi:transcription antitermination factor NusG
MIFKKNGHVIPIHLMEGYAFVATGLDEVAYFALEEQPYINRVMSTLQGPHNMRCLSVLSNAQIKAMRSKLRKLISAEIPLQAQVDILDGTYGGLDGTVIGLDDENAYVRISLRSLDVVATIPRVFLEAQ